MKRVMKTGKSENFSAMEFQKGMDRKYEKYKKDLASGNIKPTVAPTESKTIPKQTPNGKAIVAKPKAVPKDQIYSKEAMFKKYGQNIYIGEYVGGLNSIFTLAQGKKLARDDASKHYMRTTGSNFIYDMKCQYFKINDDDGNQIGWRAVLYSWGSKDKEDLKFYGKLTTPENIRKEDSLDNGKPKPSVKATPSKVISDRSKPIASMAKGMGRGVKPTVVSTESKTIPKQTPTANIPKGNVIAAKPTVGLSKPTPTVTPSKTTGTEAVKPSSNVPKGDDFSIISRSKGKSRSFKYRAKSAAPLLLMRKIGRAISITQYTIKDMKVNGKAAYKCSLKPGVIVPADRMIWYTKTVKKDGKILKPLYNTDELLNPTKYQESLDKETSIDNKTPSVKPTISKAKVTQEEFEAIKQGDDNDFVTDGDLRDTYGNDTMDKYYAIAKGEESIDEDPYSNIKPTVTPSKPTPTVTPSKTTGTEVVPTESKTILKQTPTANIPKGNVIAAKPTVGLSKPTPTVTPSKTTGTEVVPTENTAIVTKPKESIFKSMTLSELENQEYIMSKTRSGKLSPKDKQRWDEIIREKYQRVNGHYSNVKPQPAVAKPTESKTILKQTPTANIPKGNVIAAKPTVGLSKPTPTVTPSKTTGTEVVPTENTAIVTKPKESIFKSMTLSELENQEYIMSKTRSGKLSPKDKQRWDEIIREKYQRVNGHYSNVKPQPAVAKPKGLSKSSFSGTGTQGEFTKGTMTNADYKAITAKEATWVLSNDEFDEILDLSDNDMISEPELRKRFGNAKMDVYYAVEFGGKSLKDFKRKKTKGRPSKPKPSVKATPSTVISDRSKPVASMAVGMGRGAGIRELPGNEKIAPKLPEDTYNKVTNITKASNKKFYLYGMTIAGSYDKRNHTHIKLSNGMEIRLDTLGGRELETAKAYLAEAKSNQPMKTPLNDTSQLSQSMGLGGLEGSGQEGLGATPSDLNRRNDLLQSISRSSNVFNQPIKKSPTVESKLSDNDKLNAAITETPEVIKETGKAQVDATNNLGDKLDIIAESINIMVGNTGELKNINKNLKNNSPTVITDTNGEPEQLQERIVPEALLNNKSVQYKRG